MEKLKLGTKCVQNMDYEGALIEFNKVIFYDKNIPEVYAEKAEIYIKLCDFSSAIQQYKKALLIRNDDTWLFKMNQLYFMKGLTLIEEGYCNDALNLISTIETDDVKFTYLKALSYVRASNKDLAFVEIENCLAKDPNNVEVLILKGKLLWSIDKVDLGNDCFWAAHSIFPEHHEVIEFLSIQRPRAMEYYKKAVKFVFEGNKYLAMDNIQKGLELFHDMTRLLLLRAAIFRESRDYDQALSDLERASKFMFAEGLQNDVTVQIGLTYNDMGTSLF
jgi:Tfp pilus assembly protein PilF